MKKWRLFSWLVKSITWLDQKNGNVFINVIFSLLHKKTKPLKTMYTFKINGVICHSDCLNLSLQLFYNIIYNAVIFDFPIIASIIQMCTCSFENSKEILTSSDTHSWSIKIHEQTLTKSDGCSNTANFN